MSAVYDIAQNEEGFELPWYMKSTLAICNKLGVGPDSEPRRTLLLRIVTAIISTSLPLIAVGETLGSYRYGLIFGCFIFVCTVDTYWGQHRLAINCIESTPARYIVKHRGKGLNVYKEVVVNTCVFMGLWAPTLIVMIVSFTLDEVERQGLSSPGSLFYLLVALCFIMFLFMIVPGAFVNGTDFMAEIIVGEQEEFLEMIHELSFENAIRRHRSQHDQHRKIIEQFSLNTSVSSAVYVIMSALIVYDYFTMPWGHWFMLVFYVMIGLSFCIMLPLSWQKVNYAQDELKLLVAKSVGPPLLTQIGATSALKDDKGKAPDKLEAGLGQEEKKGERELWSSEERTRFLAYLQAYELKATVFGWELGPGFMGEITLLYVSMAFLMWQVTTLSKWTGFSFDKAIA